MACVRQDTYTVSLPDNLPPTFRGRALKFSYELVLGTCRAGASGMRSSSSLGPTGANSISRVMKVPIRVYNHVAGRIYAELFMFTSLITCQSGKCQDLTTYCGLWESASSPWKPHQRWWMVLQRETQRFGRNVRMSVLPP